MVTPMRVPQSPALTGVITLFLAGCVSSAGLRPTAQPLAADQLTAARSLAGTPLSPAAWPRADWWTTFADPELDRLVQQALAGNPDLAAADARARLADAQAGAADAARAPQIGAGISSSGIRIPSTVIPRPYGGHYSALDRIGLNFSYTFDLWGGQRAAWEAAVDRGHAAEVDAAAARLTLAADVARAYATLGAAERTRTIADSELRRATQVLELTRQRVGAGIDNRLDLDQAAAAVAAATADLAAQQRSVVLARVALAALLGRGPDATFTLTAHPLPPAALALPADLPAALLGRRPDIVAARWRIEAAAREIHAARAAFYPDLNLAAGLGLASLGGGSLLETASRYEQFGPALSLPLFDGGRLRANLAGRNAGYDLAVAQYNQTLIEALRQVAASVAALRTLDRESSAARQARADAASAWKIALIRYRAGIGSYIEALTVERGLLAAEQRVATLDAARVVQSIGLVQALGGGYAPTAATADPVPVPVPAVAEVHP